MSTYRASNALKYVQLVENRLGWLPPTTGPKRHVAEAAKVKRKVATNPDLYTWDNLSLAVELLARERLERSPLGVFAHVERAVAKAKEPEDDVEVQIQRAMAYEIGRGDPAGWVARFSRSVGIYRSQALTEWKESVR